MKDVKYQCISKVLDYGMMIITNYSKDKAASKQNEIIAGFFVMPKYSLNLE